MMADEKNKLKVKKQMLQLLIGSEYLLIVNTLSIK